MNLPLPNNVGDAQKVVNAVQNMAKKQFRFPLFNGGFETRALAMSIAEIRKSEGEAYYTAGSSQTAEFLDDFAHRFSSFRIGAKLLIDHGTCGNWSRPHGGMVHRNYAARKCATGAVMHTTNLVEKVGQDCPEINIDISRMKLPENVETGHIPTHIQYVLAELLKNAIEASMNLNRESPPPVTLRIAQTLEHTTFTVEDQAGGIPEDLHDRIWSYAYSSTGLEPADVGLSQMTIAGCGVGLSLSRTYGSYFGGSLELVTTSEKGSVFVLSIPHSMTAREILPLDEMWASSLSMP